MTNNIQLRNEKNQPNGYLGLDENGDIPASFLPATTGVTDHGALTGLGDDDHPQYLTTERADARYLTSATGLNHSALSNLSADDHPQYLNNTRGDARYYTKAAADAKYLTQSVSDSLYFSQSYVNTNFASKDFVASNYSPIGHAHPEYTTQTQNDVRYASVNAPTPYVLRWTGTAWPTRNSVTTSNTRTVLFIGPVTAAVPSDFVTGVDFFLKY